MKTVIITGGNSGLGYHCAQTIAQDPNWHIVLAYRSQAKTDQAVQKLQLEADSQQIEAKEFDVPFIALAQINLGVESQANKRSLMSYIKYSVDIE